MSDSCVAFRTSRGKPCPVCGSESKNCSVKVDGAHFCRAPLEDRPGWKLVKDGEEWRTYRREEDKTNLRGTGPRPTSGGKPHQNNGHADPPRDWHADAERYKDELSPELLYELTSALSLPAEALDALPLVGWCESEECWTFPEVDAAGKVVGITRRFRDTEKGKKAFHGSKRGLTIPAGWRERPGPVLVVEGASDVLALSACGLSAIGRPSNTGGAEMLADLLREVDQPVYIVGENDAKPDGTWPGKAGAESTAKRLSELLRRPVSWSLPPDGIKDSRAWVLDHIAGAAESIDLGTAGKEIASGLANRAEMIGKERTPRFEFIDSREFLAGDYRCEFLISRVFVRGQPAVIGGPSKTLKTSVALDAAISMATGSAFLGQFSVGKRVRVGFASGESGQFTLKETCLRILKAKGIDAAELTGWLKWEFTLPTFSDLESMTDFAKRLADLGVEVVVIDPLYLCLGDVDAKSVFEMGRALRPVAEMLLARGITPLTSHHANRQLPAGEVMGLEHLSHAGLAEYSRQWLLLSRRVKYAGDGTHALWLSVGGSAGHGGLWSLGIEEGVADNQNAGRTWNVTVETVDAAKSHESERKAEEKREAAKQKAAADQKAVLEAIDAEVSAGQAAATKRSIRDRTGLGDAKLRDILATLTEGGNVEEWDFQKTVGNSAKVSTTGYRRVKP